MSNDKSSLINIKANKTFDTIIYLLLSILSVVLLFFGGYYTYECTSQGLFGDMTFEIQSPFYELTRNIPNILGLQGREFFLIMILLILILLVLCSLTKLKYIKICLCAIVLISVVLFSIWGANTYNEYEYKFTSFGWAFFVELFVLIALLALSILNECGKTLIKIQKGKPDQNQE